MSEFSLTTLLYGRSSAFSVRPCKMARRCSSVRSLSVSRLPLTSRSCISGMSSAKTTSMYCPIIRRSSGTLMNDCRRVTASYSPAGFSSTSVTSRAKLPNQPSQSANAASFISSCIMYRIMWNTSVMVFVIGVPVNRWTLAPPFIARMYLVMNISAIERSEVAVCNPFIFILVAIGGFLNSWASSTITMSMPRSSKATESSREACCASFWIVVMIFSRALTSCFAVAERSLASSSSSSHISLVMVTLSSAAASCAASSRSSISSFAMPIRVSSLNPMRPINECGTTTASQSSLAICIILVLTFSLLRLST